MTKRYMIETGDYSEEIIQQVSQLGDLEDHWENKETEIEIHSAAWAPDTNLVHLLKIGGSESKAGKGVFIISNLKKEFLSAGHLDFRAVEEAINTYKSHEKLTNKVKIHTYNKLIDGYIYDSNWYEPHEPIRRSCEERVLIKGTSTVINLHKKMLEVRS